MTWLNVYGQISFPMPIPDALMLLMHWCTDAADALMLLMRWCCWSNDAADKMQIGERAHLKGIAWSSEFRTVVQCLVMHVPRASINIVTFLGALKILATCEYIRCYSETMSWRVQTNLPYIVRWTIFRLNITIHVTNCFLVCSMIRLMCFLQFTHTLDLTAEILHRGVQPKDNNITKGGLAKRLQ